MDNVVTRIKNQVLRIKPTLVDDDFLLFVVESVVDRALIYTNRDQLVVQYEKDLDDYDADDEFWEYYDFPIPTRLDRVLASSVIGVYNTIQNGNTATEGAIKSVSDNGQSVTYSEQIQSFLSSADDQALFSSSISMLDNYVLASVPGSNPRNNLYTYSGSLGEPM